MPLQRVTLADILAEQARRVGLPAPDREVKFQPGRQWAIDLVWPAARLAVECEGGTWTSRSRHTRGAGYRRDVDKYSAIALAGYLLLRVTTDMVADGSALRLVEKGLIAARFWRQVFPPNEHGCQLWSGALFQNGYGGFSVGGQAKYAHRVGYELQGGSLTPGLTLDHLCRNRRCVERRHLEEVTRAENVLRGEGVPAQNARKELCPKGHAYAGLNLGTRIAANGRVHRWCRLCNINHSRRRRGLLPLEASS